MQKSTLIAARLQELFLNGKWVANTNYQECLMPITLELALKKNGNLNTIAALTYHINYYLTGLNKVFEQGTLDISDKYSFDIPELLQETDWLSLKNEILTNATTFIEQVSKLTDSEIDGAFVRPEYGTYLRNIECVIEHSYYHLGQIVLLSKL